MPFCNLKYSDLVKHSILSTHANESSSPSETENTCSSKPVLDSSNFIRPYDFLDINCSYLSCNDLNDTYFSQSSSEFRIFHSNVRSLCKNFDAIGDTFSNCQNLPNIIALSETKLKDSTDAPQLDGYNFECVNSTTQAGGVGFYISDSLKYTICHNMSLNVNNTEDLWLDIEFENHNKLVVGVIYRHPGHKYETFCEKLCNNL